MWEERLACPESAYCCSASVRSPVDSCWRSRQPPNVQYASDVRPGRSHYYLLVSQPIKPFTLWLTSTEQGSGTDCPFKGQKEQEEESLVLVPHWLIQTVNWCCVVKDTDMRESLPYDYIIKLLKKKCCKILCFKCHKLCKTSSGLVTLPGARPGRRASGGCTSTLGPWSGTVRKTYKEQPPCGPSTHRERHSGSGESQLCGGTSECWPLALQTGAGDVDCHLSGREGSRASAEGGAVVERTPLIAHIKKNLFPSNHAVWMLKYILHWIHE